MESEFIHILLLYRDDNLPDDVVPKYWGNRGHKEDILCLAHCEPNVLVSASYDGDIIVWDVDGEKKLVRMNAYDHASRDGNQLSAYNHQVRMDAMKNRMKKTNTDSPTISSTTQSTFSTGNKSSMTVTRPSKVFYRNPLLSHPQHRSNLTTSSTNRPSSRLSRNTASSNMSGTRPCSEDWDKNNLSYTDRAVEKVSACV